MQGTVATYDAGTLSGTVLLDDGTPMAFDEAAFRASGMRLLRFGQRVRLDTDTDGHVTRISIPTMP
jgi:cold shock CspA family protein